MKRILFILLLTIPFIGFGQNRYHIDKVTSPNDTLTYLKKDMSLLNGNVYCEIGEMGKYVNGKKEGLWKSWYENGQLKNKGNWKNDRRDGQRIEYYKNSQVKEEVFHRNGIPTGKWVYYNPDGTISKEIFYKEGQLVETKE